MYIQMRHVEKLHRPGHLLIVASNNVNTTRNQHNEHTYSINISMAYDMSKNTSQELVKVTTGAPRDLWTFAAMAAKS